MHSDSDPSAGGSPFRGVDAYRKPGLPKLILLSSSDWVDYELIDSGAGSKLERFGAYRVRRPELQAVWQPASDPAEWETAHLIFTPGSEDQESGWDVRQPTPQRWEMKYKNLKFWVQPTPFRHMGVFPEQAPQWDWMAGLIEKAKRPVKVLDLFGYTGVSTLALAAAGAAVTHLDASKKAVTWAHENQILSGLENKPIRWIVDDALKFVRREVRRGVRYDGFVMDPPKFGRGPKGEIWKFEESLPELLRECRQLLSDQPLFVVLTAYAFRASALSLYYAIEEMMSGREGNLEAGETVLVEKSAGRQISTSIFARWSPDR